MGSVSNGPKYPFCDSVSFQFLLDSISTEELITERRFHKCISQFCAKEQHQPPPSQLVLLCTGDTPRSGQSANHKPMMEIMLAIYTAQGIIRYQGQVLFPQVSLQSSGQKTWQSQNNQRVQKLQKSSYSSYLRILRLLPVEGQSVNSSFRNT